MIEQLREGWERSGLTLDELAAKADLRISKHGLSRKLRGLQPLIGDEGERLAVALGIVATIGGKSSRRKARA